MMNGTRIYENLDVLKYEIFQPLQGELGEFSRPASLKYPHRVLTDLIDLKMEMQHQISGARREMEEDPFGGLSALPERMRPFVENYAGIWSRGEAAMEIDLVRHILASEGFRALSGEEKAFLKKTLGDQLQGEALWEESLSDCLQELTDHLEHFFDEDPYDDEPVSVNDFINRLNTGMMSVFRARRKRVAAEIFEEYVKGISSVLRSMDEAGRKAVVNHVMKGLLTKL